MAEAGSQTFTSNGTFTVPADITSVTVCMVGGGGGGSASETAGDWSQGGGFKGAEVNSVVAVTPGATYSIIVGAGGGGRDLYGGQELNGYPGTASSALGLTAAGGAGGYARYNGHFGNGAAVSGCGGGSYKDGIKTGNSAFGGQGSSFGHGGNGGDNGASPSHGDTGAGGGSIDQECCSNVPSGSGGRGEVRISWLQVAVPPPEPEPIPETGCCSYVPKTFIPWKDGVDVPVLIPPYLRSK